MKHLQELKEMWKRTIEVEELEKMWIETKKEELAEITKDWIIDFEEH